MSANEAIELLEGRLASTRRAEVLAELAACTTCRALVEVALRTSAGLPAQVDVPPELAGYVIGDVIGAGAGGVVVRARDPVLERDVALKLVRTSGEALREARTLAMLRHPAVVAVYATGAVEQLAYVAMELVAGESLADRIARGPLPWRRAVAQFAEIADGLAAIHGAGLVHRDIKPGNLLVDGDRIRIADFGLAVRGGDPALVGTLPYLAPEVLDGGAATVQSDLYALFASLYEAICGERPHHELDRRALRAAIAHGPAWPATLPRRVRAVIARGLAVDPAARYRDARDAAAALRRLGARRYVVPVLVAAGAATALVVALPRGAACEATAPAWTAQLAPLAATDAARFARLATRVGHIEAELASARCTSDRPATRACLDELEQRVAPIVAAVDRRGETERALFALPAPATCATAPPHDAPLVDRTLLAGAQAALDRGEPKVARQRASLVASPDADVVLGRASLALSDAVGAARAFRTALDGATTDDTAIAANLGLAVAVGVRQHEPAAGEAYATTARTLAGKLGDARRAAVARALLGDLAFAAGDSARGDRALAAAIDELGPLDAPLDVAQALLDRAAISRRAGAFDRARGYIEQAFALRSAALGLDHPDTIRIDEERAKIDQVDGHARRAIETMARAVARLEQRYGRDDIVLAGPLATLGGAQLLAGDYPAAERSLTRVLALYRAERGELDRDVADAYSNLAGLRVIQGRFADAAELYRAGLVAARSVLGDDHPDVAPMYYGLGVALGSARDFAGASDADAHAIAIYRVHPGHDGALATALAARALIELGLEHLDVARRDGEDALAIMTRLHGDDHVALAPALSALAQVELAAKHLDRARGYIERAIAIHVRVHAAPRQLVEERLVLAQIQVADHHRADAIATARAALADLGDHDPALAARVAAWLRSI